MKTISQRAMDLFRELDTDIDEMHRRIILVAMVAEIRVRLKSSESDIQTMDEAARMALWQVAHSHASRAEKNATLQAEERYVHGLVNELDFHDGD